MDLRRIWPITIPPKLLPIQACDRDFNTGLGRADFVFAEKIVAERPTTTAPQLLLMQACKGDVDTALAEQIYVCRENRCREEHNGMIKFLAGNIRFRLMLRFMRPLPKPSQVLICA